MKDDNGTNGKPAKSDLGEFNQTASTVLEGLAGILAHMKLQESLEKLQITVDKLKDDLQEIRGDIALLRHDTVDLKARTQKLREEVDKLKPDPLYRPADHNRRPC